MRLHRCKMCGCYLDPREGYLCDDCKENIPIRSGNFLRGQHSRSYQNENQLDDSTRTAERARDEL